MSLQKYYFKGRILVIDDKDELLAALEKALRAWGHEVFATREPEEGIDLIKNHEFDVCLIDICLKDDALDQTGMIILRDVVKRPFSEPIMMTAYGTTATAAESLRAGAFDYIQKGVPPDGGQEFLERVGDAVERALATREVHKALAEALLQIKGSMDFLDRCGRNSPEVDDAQNAVRLAAEAYKRLLITRGKRPDPIP